MSAGLPVSRTLASEHPVAHVADVVVTGGGTVYVFALETPAARE